MKRYQNRARQRSYERVVLGLALASDDTGAHCGAHDREIARWSGLTLRTVKGYLRDMEDAGEVAIFPMPCIRSGRVIVLMDHPDALATCGITARISRGSSRLSRHEAEAKA